MVKYSKLSRGYSLVGCMSLKKFRKKSNTLILIYVHRLYTVNFARINFMYRNTLYIKYLNRNLNLNRVYKLLTYKQLLYKL